MTMRINLGVRTLKKRMKSRAGESATIELSHNEYLLAEGGQYCCLARFCITYEVMADGNLDRNLELAN